MSSATFHRILPEARDSARLALEDAGLATADLDEPGIMLFGLSDDHGLIGCVGLEGDGRERLLRSLVVLPSRRARGHGRALVRCLETRIADQVDRLHLLTESATPFFRALGYSDTDRAAAPPAIAGTAQFRALCPATATYLTKDLR